MAFEQYVNLAASTAASALIGSGTSAQFNVAGGAGALFPATPQFRVTVSNADGTNAEPMLCTAISGDALTVLRGASASLESPTPTALVHAVGSLVSHNLTAGAMNQIRIDTHQQGPSLSAASQKQGNLYFPNNGINLSYDNGSSLNPYGPFYEFGDPNAQTWNFLNQGSTTVSTTNGGIALINTATETPTSQPFFHGYVFTVPATPYHVIIGYSYVGQMGQAGNSNTNFINGGLWTDGTKVLLVGLDNSNNPYNQYIGFFNPVALSGGYTGFSAVLGATQFENKAPLQWLRLGDNGTNRTVDIGPTPYNWMNIYTQGNTVGLTPTKIGFGINGGPCIMHIHSVQVTA